MKKTQRVIDNPIMMKEWNYERNNSLGFFPENFSIGSGQKVWWVCEKGHEYESIINSRKRGSGCPYCAGKKALRGFNDFESKYPDLAKEWHPTKNNGLLPSQVTYGSGKKVWWQCDNNHSYLMCPRDKARSVLCPVCAQVYKTSFPEQAIFYYIKECFPDAISRYRDIFKNNMELDIFIPSLKVGIEYDGLAFHDKNRLKADNDKYIICRKNGISLIRVMETKKPDVFRLYDHKIEIPNGQRKYLNGAITFLCSKLGKDVDVDIERDRVKITEYLSLRKGNLADEYPELVKEWDYDFNYPLRPENFPSHSNERVGWVCGKCGHKWVIGINSRTGKQVTGCPKCSGKTARSKQIKNKIDSEGSLYDLYPDLMEEWDFESNTIDPKTVLPGSKEKAKWICKKCGFHWEAPINKRTKGHGCLLCSNQTVVKGINDLETLNPKLASEWNYSKNKLKPSEVALKSNRKFWWKCPVCDHEWEQSPHNRSKGSGCPCCSGRVPKKGMNDFKTLYPELAKDWDYEKNETNPEEYLPYSHFEANWKCRYCDFRYKKIIRNRIRNPKCPNCQKYDVIKKQ